MTHWVLCNRSASYTTIAARHTTNREIPNPSPWTITPLSIIHWLVALSISSVAVSDWKGRLANVTRVHLELLPLGWNGIPIPRVESCGTSLARISSIQQGCDVEGMRLFNYWRRWLHFRHGLLLLERVSHRWLGRFGCGFRGFVILMVSVGFSVST